MDVRSDRRYRFAVERDTLWAAIANVDDYRTWWPWLRAFDADGLVAGDIWTCVVQPPLPYSLRFTISIDEVVESRLVTATVAGDVVGSARVELADHETGCEARMISALAPGSGFLRTVATAIRPLARFGHDWVLDTGARQFSKRAV